ncbi:hypothetical protein CBM2586_B130046 [Cupriavidus phytorum]|uniref:Uncharacterized protein n=1 Tax=Cupriavidus taiwanensis TaxID=164546 RepID=A0A976A9P5_9BURK|nr:hypothetical protein CBM2586_B130046 [Cupriavidus taiwanensis]
MEAMPALGMRAVSQRPPGSVSCNRIRTFARDINELVIEIIYAVTNSFAKINNLSAALSLQSPSH